MTEPTPDESSSPSSWSPDRLDDILRDTMNTHAQEQRELGELLGEVRAALDGQNVTAVTASLQESLGRAVDRLAAQIAAGVEQQTVQLERFAARLADDRDTAAREAAARDAAAREATPQDIGGPSLHDVHDGLAGIRTDIAGLPEQLTPAMTGLVHATIAETMKEVGTVRQNLADTVAETSALRSYLAQLGTQLSALPELLTGLTALTDRLSQEVAASTTAKQDLTAFPALLDDRFDAHFSAFGVGLGGRLDELETRIAQSTDIIENRIAGRLDSFIPGQEPGALSTDELTEAITDAVDSQIRSQLAGTETNLQERLSSVESNLGDRFASADHTLSERLSGVESTLDERLAGAQTTLNDRLVEHLNAVQGAVGGRIEQLENTLAESAATSGARLDEQSSRLDEAVGDRLDTHLDALATAFGERLDHLATQVSGLLDRHDDDAATDAAADAAAAAGEPGPDLHAQLTALAADVSTLRGALTERIDALHVAVAEGAEPPLPPGPGADDVGRWIAHAVTASEERLTATINEAVYALAEVLLRRTPDAAPDPMIATPRPPAPPTAPVVYEPASIAEESQDDDGFDAAALSTETILDAPPTPDDTTDAAEDEDEFAVASDDTDDTDDTDDALAAELAAAEFDADHRTADTAGEPAGLSGALPQEFAPDELEPAALSAYRPAADHDDSDDDGADSADPDESSVGWRPDLPPGPAPIPPQPRVSAPPEKRRLFRRSKD